jgi:hypothetical protein
VIKINRGPAEPGVPAEDEGTGAAVSTLFSPEPPPQPVIAKTLSRKAHDAHRPVFKMVTGDSPWLLWGFFDRWVPHHNRQTMLEKRLTHDGKT